MRQPGPVFFKLAAFGAVVGALGLALSGCGSKGGTSPAASPQEASPPAPPQTSTNRGPAQWPTEGSSPTRLSGDGRYFGFVRAASADPFTIGFDIAQFFYGKSKQKAAEEDGAVRPGEPVSNDHYERNSDEAIATLKVDGGAYVTAGVPSGYLSRYVTRKAASDCQAAAPEGTFCTQIPLSLATFVAAVKQLDDKSYGVPVWVTVRDGVVVRIDEQYFP